MRASTRSLLTGILDYAGTFPPASLSLAESVAHYAQVRSGAERWLLGRLIVPSASLPEFDALAVAVPVDEDEPPGEARAMRASAPGPRHNWSQALAVRRQAEHTTYRIASLEFPPLGPSEIGD